ncbi:Nucleolar protein 12 [Sorochytrium milnesiophthora]
MDDNWSALTHGGKVWHKKRSERQKTQEITFDEDQRKEFLTGFHKRNVERKKRAQARDERLKREERTEKRRAKRQVIAEMAREMERSRQGLLTLQDAEPTLSSDEGEQQQGDVAVTKRRPDRHTAEVTYAGDNIVTTVTTVTDFVLDDVTMGWNSTPVATGGDSRDDGNDQKRKRGSGSESDDDDDEEDAEEHGKDGQEEEETGKPKKSGDGEKTQRRKKSRNFKYESKSARKAQVAKQRKKGSKRDGNDKHKRKGGRK